MNDIYVFGRISALAVLLLATGCGAGEPAGGRELLVAAAANLGPVAGELAAEFERADTGSKVTFSFGSSGNLAAQIRNGAPFDIYLPAGVSFCRPLEQEGLIPEGCGIYARGVLVVWSNTEELPRELAGLADSRYRTVAIANPEIAPYGLAARQALERAGLWDGLEPRIVIAESVSHAFQMVESGNAEAGLLALSLVIGRKAPYLLVDESLYDPIEQAAGVLARSQHREMAERFAAFLGSPEAQAILERHGYVPVDSGGDASEEQDAEAGGDISDSRR